MVALAVHPELKAELLEGIVGRPIVARRVGRGSYRRQRPAHGVLAIALRFRLMALAAGFVSDILYCRTGISIVRFAGIARVSRQGLCVSFSLRPMVFHPPATSHQ